MSQNTEKPQIIEILINERTIKIKEFVQNVIAALNLGVFIHLKGIPDKKEINNFEIQIDNQAELGKSSKIVVLMINGKHIGNKPFVQDMIRGYNIGLIQTLENIPQNIKNIKIIFKR